MSEWISVKDRLPEKMPYRWEMVIVHKENGVIMEAMYNTRVGEFMKDFNSLSCKVTHWQPLPPPPKD